MEKNQLIKRNGTVYRVLAVEEDEVLLIDCMKKIMPKWHELGEIAGYEVCTENELLEMTETFLMEEQSMPPKTRQTVHKRFTVIAGILLYRR